MLVQNSERTAVALLGDLVESLDRLEAVLIEQQDERRYDGPLTRDQAAEYLHVHPDTLYKWAVKGDVAYHRLGNGAKAPLRFYKKDLDDFVGQYRIPIV